MFIEITDRFGTTINFSKQNIKAVYCYDMLIRIEYYKDSEPIELDFANTAECRSQYKAIMFNI